VAIRRAGDAAIIVRNAGPRSESSSVWASGVLMMPSLMELTRASRSLHCTAADSTRRRFAYLGELAPVLAGAARGSKAVHQAGWTHDGGIPTRIPRSPRKVTTTAAIARTHPARRQLCDSRYGAPWHGSPEAR
jgi:hypothetical protein